MKRLKTDGWLLVMASALLWAQGVSAVEYTWINSGINNKWTNLSNWHGGAGFPSAAGDIADVSDADTIHFDTNGMITIGRLQLSGGTPKTVTLDGDAGSVLSFSGIEAPYGGFLVKDHADNRLVVKTGIDFASGVDKTGIGAIEFTGAVTSRVASGYGFVFGSGSALFSGTSSLSAPSSTIGIGNGEWAAVMLTNQAAWRVHRLELGVASSAPTKGYLTQASDDCSVIVQGEMVLGQMNSGGNTNSFYALGQGLLTTVGLTVGAQSPASFEQSGGTLMVTNITVNAGLYQQSGGTSVFANSFEVGAAGKTPHVELQGGTLQLNSDITTGGIASEQAFHFSGGTLQTPKSSSIRIPLRVSGNPVFDVPAGGGLTIREGISGNANIIKTGAGGVGLGWMGASAMLSGNLTISNGYFSIPAGVELGSYAGSTAPMAVTICNGGILQLADITSNITVPLALNIESGGKIEFEQAGGNYNRGIVVAHTLATNGVALLPGRYTTAHWFVTGSTPACSVVVPRVWSGGGDNVSWNDAANWVGGVVPNAETESADLSYTHGTVRLDSAVELTCLIYNPQTSERELTLTGDGSLTLCVVDNLDDVKICLFVGPGRTLTLDVPLARAPEGTICGITGNGSIVIKKGFPGIGPFQFGSFALNARLVFAGETAMGDKYLGFWRHELSGDGAVIFTNGCRLTCGRLLNNPAGYYAVRRVYHDGGDVTCGDVYWTRHNSADASPHAYYMRSGSLTTTAVDDGIALGCFYSGAWTRYSGGAFVMSGGIVNTARLAMGFPDNLFDLHGGTLNLGGLGIISTSVEQGTVKLGGVTIHATANWSSTLAMELSGINGPALFETAGRTVSLSGALSGPGGLAKMGSGTLTLGGMNTFTGALTVAEGTLIANSGLQNATNLSVTASGAMLTLGSADSLNPNAVLNIAAGGLVNLNFSGTATVSELVVNGGAKSPGTYNNSKPFLTGTGALVVLNGPPPGGTLIFVR